MLIKRDFVYSPKGSNRPLHIWLPEGYFETGERYPVMYFFDGHNLFRNEDATYGKSWGLKEFLEQWDKPMIIVGMECGHEAYERLYEYTPYAADWIEGSEENKLGEETFRWIIEEVKPVIDREYRTYPFRECTAIGGSSMGGLMALYGVIKHNRWFSKAACVSSAIGFCMDRLLSDLHSSAIAPDTRVYLSWGTKEAFGIENPNKEDRSSSTYHWNKQIVGELQTRRAVTRLRCQVGGGHCEADWEQLVPEFMSFLWQNK